MKLIEEYIQIVNIDYWNFFFVYEDGDRLTDKEGEILAIFKLPVCYYYSSEMRNIFIEKGKNKEYITALFNFLTNESIYYNQRTISDIYKLSKAKEYLADTEDILKSLLITYNSYVAFLYEDLYLANKITVEEMEKCINFYRRIEKSGIMNLYKYHDVFQNKSNFRIRLFLELKELQTPYFDEFILKNENHFFSDVFVQEYEYKEWCSTAEPLFNRLNLIEFRILYIRTLNYYNLYFLHITFNDNNNTLNRIIVIANHEAVIQIISNAKNSFEATVVEDALNDINNTELDIRMLLTKEGLVINGLSLFVIKEPQEKIYIIENINSL